MSADGVGSADSSSTSSGGLQGSRHNLSVQRACKQVLFSHGQPTILLDVKDDKMKTQVLQHKAMEESTQRVYVTRAAASVAASTVASITTAADDLMSLLPMQRRQQ